MPAVRQMEQTYCDWCYDELSAESMAKSRELGLCDLDCCACDDCLDAAAYQTAPKGWVSRFGRAAGNAAAEAPWKGHQPDGR
jgi:hypothetical protein